MHVYEVFLRIYIYIYIYIYSQKHFVYVHCLDMTFLKVYVYCTFPDISHCVNV